jgi:pimeloyl-ACP methyl ester carboxylesterase
VMGADITPAKALENVAQMRKYMGAQTQEAYERSVKSGASTRSMVEKESDFERIVAWGLATDRTAALDAMAELFSADLREEIAKIQCPVLVMGTYIGYPTATRASVEASLKQQYAKVSKADLQVSDRAHHFIMWDDPDWMFANLDRFLK